MYGPSDGRRRGCFQVADALIYGNVYTLPKKLSIKLDEQNLEFEAIMLELSEQR